MLEFTDRPRTTRVYRRHTTDNTREAVATINKGSLQVVLDSGVVLSAEEEAELSQVIELQSKAELLQRQVWTLTLPSVLRETIDYCEDASLHEVRLLSRAVLEAHSRLKAIMARRT